MPDLDEEDSKLTKDTPPKSGEVDARESGNQLVNRRDFMQGSAVALATVMVSKAGELVGTAEAKSLIDIVAKTEADVYYRDRLPDYQTPFANSANDTVSLFDWDFPSLVTSATGDGTFGTQGMPSNFSTDTTVPSTYNDMPVAIIGAGAAGLAAGYELMKLGFQPHFYEMQTQVDADNDTYARPNGRIYSWDYGGNGMLDGAGAGWYPNDTLTTGNTSPVYGRNVHKWGRRVAELGGMRFPATHLTLRTYTDEVFSNDYYYGPGGLTTPWVPFRDPGLYDPTNSGMTGRGGVVEPNYNDTVVFDTAYYTKGIFKDRSSSNPPAAGGYAELDRVKSGTTLLNSNYAVQNLTFKYFDLLYGSYNPVGHAGVLTPILTLYSAYKTDPNQDTATAIAVEWKRLIDVYDKKSLREVLTEAGWDDLPAYSAGWGDLNISLSEMFGEIGTGTGPFAMFYYSSFMELLRIALQAADSNQDYFLGGASYQLQPFLTHFTPTSSGSTGTNCLWNMTQNKVVTDKVVAVQNASNGVSVTTEDASRKQTTKTYTAVIVTAAPSAIRAANLFPVPDAFIPSRAVSYIKRVRINNNSKIAINFPNINGQEYSSAFWMARTNANDTNPNNDLIVTTLTDKTIRQIYTFDNYHWATTYNDTTNIGSFAKQGTLLLNYGWDYNAQSWTASDTDAATRLAWSQMTEIYGFGTKYDDYLEWAITNKQAAFIVWEKVDGFNAAWRMAQPGRGTEYGNDTVNSYASLSEFQTAQTFGMTSYNPETSKYIGLFIAGEATASPGLSGWVEGSIQTALQAVAGTVKFLNVDKPQAQFPAATTTGTSFALQAHPGFNSLQSS